MFKVDPINMTIYLTRGDSASIVFSAKTQSGEVFHPTLHDRLIFSSAKHFGEEPLIEVMNEMGDNEEMFWTISLEPYHTENLKFGEYCFDVQLELRNEVTGELESVCTIIGETCSITPTLVLWGEVSQESE